jgi:hypothetical protein
MRKDMESKQTDMFHECIEDAITADVMALGGYGKVAGWLFPHLQPDQGKAHMRACLNADRAEKLSPPQTALIVQKARDIGSRATADYLQGMWGCRIEFLNPADEAADLRRDVLELGKVLMQRLDRLDRAEARVVAIRK